MLQGQASGSALMAINPQTAAFLAQLAAGVDPEAPVPPLAPETSRAGYLAMASVFGVGPDLARVKNDTIESINPHPSQTNPVYFISMVAVGSSGIWTLTIKNVDSLLPRLAARLSAPTTGLRRSTRSLLDMMTVWRFCGMCIIKGKTLRLIHRALPSQAIQPAAASLPSSLSTREMRAFHWPDKY